MNSGYEIALSSEVAADVSRLIQEDPKLHDWGHGLVSGGLSGNILTTLSHFLLDEFGSVNFKSIETGAGLSTLVFAAAKPLSHTVINPDEELKTRIISEIKKREYDISAIDYITECSEYALPKIAQNLTVDLALIDGGHGWPTVFVDFCYTNMMLREGGILVVDDIQAFPCGQLFLLLKNQPGWKLESVVWSKTAFFRKENNLKLLPDFGGQPYLLANMITT